MTSRWRVVSNGNLLFILVFITTTWHRTLAKDVGLLKTLLRQEKREYGSDDLDALESSNTDTLTRHYSEHDGHRHKDLDTIIKTLKMVNGDSIQLQEEEVNYDDINKDVNAVIGILEVFRRLAEMDYQTLIDAKLEGKRNVHAQRSSRSGFGSLINVANQYRPREQAVAKPTGGFHSWGG